MDPASDRRRLRAWTAAYALLAALGADPWPMTPKTLGDRVVSEIKVWAPIVKASGAKVDG